MLSSRLRSTAVRIARAVLMAKEKIVVGISGGLDSAHTAKELLDKGYEVIGVYLCMHDAHPEALENAKAVANELGIELIYRDVREEFERIVVGDFLNEYLHGRTPNPCVVCNRHVKVKMLCECAKELGASKVATGHYAKAEISPSGRYTLARADDLKKDQSYMLWGLTQEMISMLLLPMSDKTKSLLKEKDEFSVSKNKESQEICFVPDDDYIGFIESKIPKEKLPKEGNYINENGDILGRHKGIHHYTIGQRRRLGIALGQRCFITKIDPETDNITLGFGGDEYCSRFEVKSINVVGGIDGDEYLVKSRYRAEPVECRVEFIDDDRAIVTPLAPIRAVTSGQSAVFYSGNQVAFGGIIA